MIKQWRELDQNARQSIQHGFLARAQAEDWVEQLNKITLRHLFAYALNSDSDKDTKVAQALQSDVITRKRYLEILDHLGARSMVTAKAAASDSQAIIEGQSSNESGHQWQYRLGTATAPPYECYLIIELDTESPPPTRFLAVSEQFGYAELTLAEAHRGIIQMAFQNTDPLVKILQDPDRQVRIW